MKTISKLLIILFSTLILSACGAFLEIDDYDNGHRRHYHDDYYNDSRGYDEEYRNRNERRILKEIRRNEKEIARLEDRIRKLERKYDSRDSWKHSSYKRNEYYEEIRRLKRRVEELRERNRYLWRLIRR